jgi:hypothetical protein
MDDKFIYDMSEGKGRRRRGGEVGVKEEGRRRR